MTSSTTSSARRIPAGKLVAISSGIFLVVATLGWSTWAQTCPTFPSGISSPGTNPCNFGLGMCSATGSGYTCTILGGGSATELCYKITGLVSPWKRCSTAQGKGQCTETWSTIPCGHTEHYPQPYPGATSCGIAGGCGTSCTGNWDWYGCVGP